MLYRAYKLSFTHDEAISYTDYTYQSYGALLDPPNTSANNHILNSWAMRFMRANFNSSALALRLPNVLAFIMYFLFSALWLRQFRNRLLQVSGIILLCLHPYLLDFFSLARGYGLAIGFMTGSLFNLDKYLKNNSATALFCTLLFGILAVLSNLALLNYFICLPVFIIANTTKLSKKDILSSLWDIGLLVAFCILLYLILRQPVLHLRQAHALYFGGDNDIWHDTFGTICSDFMYDHTYPFPYQDYIQYLLLLAFILSLTIAVLKIYRLKFRAISLPVCYLPIIVALIALSMVLQHALFRTPFLIDRTALFILPVVLFMLIAVINELQSWQKTRIGSSAVLFVLSVLTIWHFTLMGNLNYCRDWSYDADVKHIMQYMNKVKPAEPGKKITIGMSWLHMPAAVYYTQVWQQDWLSPQSFESDKRFDYYVVDGDNLDDFKAVPLRKVQRFTIMNYYLMRYIR